MTQQDYLDKLGQLKDQLLNLGQSYWSHYCNAGTWQFWVNIAALIIPLIVLYFRIDRLRIFQILFFGYTIHMLMNYLDSFGTSRGLVTHPYPLIPDMPVNLSINTSLIPVVFMLTYQYGVNHSKNVYLVGLVASAGTGFVLGTVARATGFLQLHNGMNIWYLFLIDYIEFILAHWLTQLVLRLGKFHEAK